MSTTDYTRTAAQAAEMHAEGKVQGLHIASQHRYDQLSVSSVMAHGDRVTIAGWYRNGQQGTETWNADDRVTLTYTEPVQA